MKLFVRFLAIFLTAVLLIGATVWILVCTGYVFFIFALALGGIVLLGTLVTQLILFLTLRGCRSLVYDFFFFASYTSSALLLFMYYLYSAIMNSLEEMANMLTMQDPDSFGDASAASFEADGMDMNGYFGIQLFLFVPIIVQVVLTVYRARKLNQLRQEEAIAINKVS